MFGGPAQDPVRVSEKRVEFRVFLNGVLLVGETVLTRWHRVWEDGRNVTELRAGVAKSQLVEESVREGFGFAQ